jgi:hypothetical protein
VVGGNPVGGFAGYANSSTIVPYTQCFSLGNVTSNSTSGSFCGGFCGILGANCLDCYAIGNVLNNSILTQDRIAGGFAGSVDSGFGLINCYSKGIVNIS